MVIMDGNFYDRLRELHHKIEKYHLSYLEMEESVEKMEYRIKLEDYIKSFLCMAGHNEKFCYPQTAEVLYRSARSKTDFSGYKAATGWNALQMYAGNLLSQPWRQEYRRIKTYCGFYMHQIEANLVGAEIMFEAMGYKHVDEGLLVLEGPICPDLVKNVSKDCLMAYVECQILKQIWEQVSILNVTWLDLLEFRRKNICDAERCIETLKYQAQKHYQVQHHQQNQELLSPSVAVNSFPSTLSGHHHVALPPPPPPPVGIPQFMYGNCCAGTYAPLPPANYMYMQYMSPPMMKMPTYNTNGYYYSNGCTQAAPPYCVPTGQLIEYEPNGYDMTDRPSRSRKHSEAPTITSDYQRNKNNNDMKRFDSEERENEDWNYVYRDLERQGYTKDLGERGDILVSSTTSRKDQKKVKSTNLDEVQAMTQLVVSDRPLKVSEVVDKLDKRKASQPPPESRHSQSSYENNPSDVVATNKSTRTAVPAQLSTKEELPKRKIWQCKHCTYINEPSHDICDICHKSRNSTDEQPEIGGAECPQCTLVNPKHAAKCIVCNENLKGSPTYI